MSTHPILAGTSILPWIKAAQSPGESTVRTVSHWSWVVIAGEYDVRAIAIHPGQRPPFSPSQPYILIQSNGLYTVPNLPPGDYKVQISSQYWPANTIMGFSQKRKRHWSGYAGQRYPGIDFTLEKGGSISGNVYQADGKTPLDEAKVSVTATGSSFSRSYTTDADGSYSFSHLPDGHYRERVEAQGYVALYYD